MDAEPLESPAAEDAPPLDPAPPVTNRFLFVDIAAQRAKQLRRGALPRLDESTPDGGHRPHKAERVAMEEVRRGLVQYELPVARNGNQEEAA